MAAKTEDYNTPFKVLEEGNNIQAIPVASGQTIYGGTIAGILASSGYLVNLTASTAPLCRAVAYVLDSSDNASGPAATTANGSISGTKQEGSAPAGDKTVRRCSLNAKIQISATSITQAMLFKKMYAANNWTFDDVQGGGIAIGSLVTYISATSGIVELNKFYEEGEAVLVARGDVIAATTTTGGDAISWSNQTGETIYITDMILDITTQATGVATADVGVAANGTTSSDTIFDGVDVGTAAILASFNSGNEGTNGTVKPIKVTASQYVTMTPSATLAGLVGTYKILYIKAL